MQADPFRSPDNPIARRLAEARAQLERDRAEEAERDRANEAAIEDFRTMLAAMDPPLTVQVRPPKGPSYAGDRGPEHVFMWAPTVDFGHVVCPKRDARTAIEREAGTAHFAERLEGLLEAERAAVRAATALSAPPATEQATTAIVRDTERAFGHLWAGLLAAGAVAVLGWAIVSGPLVAALIAHWPVAAAMLAVGLVVAYRERRFRRHLRRD